MTSQKLFPIIVSLVLIFSGCTTTKESFPKSDTITFGWVGPLTGDVSQIGSDALAAAQIAIEEINDTGGVLGRSLELLPEDTKCLARDAAAAGTKLLNVDEVDAIIGGTCSSETNAIAPLAEESETLLVSYCSTAPTISDAGDYTFRTIPSDAFDGAFAAEYMYNRGIRNVAVMATIGDWGTGIKNVFEERFEELGGTIVLSEDFNQEENDFRTQLTKIKEANVDVLYIPAYTSATISLLTQYTELGLTADIYGASTWSDTTIHQEAVANGIKYFLVKTAQENNDFAAKLAEKNATDTACAKFAYDAVHVVAKAMETAGETTGAMVKEALYNTTHDGLTGRITFDNNGDVTSANYDVYEIINNQAVIVE